MQPSRPTRPSQIYHDRHAYMPPHVQAAMARQMKISMPAHMRQYADAYVQQNLASQPMSAELETPRPEHNFVARPGLSGPGNSDHGHFHPDAEASVSAAVPGTTIAASPGPQAGTAADASPATPDSLSPPAPTDSYDFIMHPQDSPKQRWPRLESWPQRAAVIGGAVIVLWIILTILKSLLSSGFDVKPFLAVAQDQQAIIYVASYVSTQQQNQGLSANSQSFAATVQLSVSSAQAALVGDLLKGGHKLSSKQLNLKLSPSIQTQLTSAAAAGTYDQAFQSLMKTELNAYSADLVKAYGQYKDQKSRSLLNNYYNQAKLLLTQLNVSG